MPFRNRREQTSNAMAPHEWTIWWMLERNIRKPVLDPVDRTKSQTSMNIHNSTFPLKFMFIQKIKIAPTWKTEFSKKKFKSRRQSLNEGIPYYKQAYGQHVLSLRCSQGAFGNKPSRVLSAPCTPLCVRTTCAQQHRPFCVGQPQSLYVLALPPSWGRFGLIGGFGVCFISSNPREPLLQQKPSLMSTSTVTSSEPSQLKRIAHVSASTAGNLAFSSTTFDVNVMYRQASPEKWPGLD